MKHQFSFLLFLFAVAGLLLSTGTQEVLAKEKPASKVIETEDVLVNVNTGTKEDLLLIRGIGPKLADRIVTYRQEKGAFKEIQDLMLVNGVGEAKFEKIKSHVTV